MSDSVTHGTPLSVGFPMQEYWSGLPFPSPGDLPDPGIELMSLVSLALAGRFFTTSTTWNYSLCVVHLCVYIFRKQNIGNFKGTDEPSYTVSLWVLSHKKVVTSELLICFSRVYFKIYLLISLL